MQPLADATNTVGLTTTDPEAVKPIRELIAPGPQRSPLPRALLQAFDPYMYDAPAS